MEPLAADDPRQVGGFRLHSRLGAGGMGRVYLGYSQAGRAVAVKVIHPTFARDPEFVRRFKREVRAAEAVGGAYTAPVVAAGPDDDPPWLATVFVPGPSLADVVAEAGPLPEPAVWRLAGGLIEALQAVHACGLVHRDLKPANVLLADDGPRVIDFGISRALEGTTATATGMIVGTPGFLSPEQATGSPVGPSADVFALGAVIAFAATGGSPFGTGEPVAMAYRVVHAEPDISGVPVPLRDLVARCLAKEPAGRPSLTRMMDEVMAASAAHPGVSPESFWPEPVAGLVRSRPDRSLLEGFRAEAPFGGAATRPPRYEPAAPSAPGGRLADTDQTRTGYTPRRPDADRLPPGRRPPARRSRIIGGAAAFVAGGVAAALIALFLTSQTSAQPPSHAGHGASSPARTTQAALQHSTSGAHRSSSSPTANTSPSATSSSPTAPAVVTALVCTQPANGCSGSYGIPYMKSRPSQVVNSGDGSAYVNHIMWSGWGTATATGHGTLHLDSCQPSCANGTYTGYPATVTVSALSPYTNGAEAYSNMVISAPTAPTGRFPYTGLVPLSRLRKARNSAPAVVV